MHFTPPSLASLLAFVVLMLCVQGALVAIAWRGGGRRMAVRAALVSLAAACFTSVMSAYVVSPDRFGPTALTLASLNIAAIAIALSPAGKRLGAGATMGAWVLFHAFRLPLEVILHVWHDDGTLPVQMTWSGQNFDVIAGIAALVVGAVLLKRPSRALATAFHVLGLALLANVIRIAMSSTPGFPFRAFDEPVLLAFHVPYVLIVPLAVVTALLAHVVALRALWSPVAKSESPPHA